jgi:hypothetical protein
MTYEFESEPEIEDLLHRLRSDRDLARKVVIMTEEQMDKAYIFTYEAGPNEYYTYLPMIKNMIYSFQITANPLVGGTPQNISTTAWKDFGDFSDLANIPLVGGIVASHSVATHILHNEQGVFIPWSVICAQGSQYLLKPCSSLVNLPLRPTDAKLFSHVCTPREFKTTSAILP